MYFCCGSFENAMSQTDPSPSVRRAMSSFLHERAVGPEHLDAIVRPVADVDEAIVRELRAVYRVAELLRGRRIRIVGPQVRVVRLVAVRAPVALELAGLGVDDRHPLVAVAVGQVDLVRLSDRRRSWRRGRSFPCRCCRLLMPCLPNCSRNLPTVRELQDVRVLRRRCRRSTHCPCGRR